MQQQQESPPGYTPYAAAPAAPGPPSRTARYQATTSFVLNIIQIVCGGLVALTTIIGEASAGGDKDLSGLRYGSLFIFAGLLGLGAAKYKSYGFIIPNMVMSILATICAVGLTLNLGLYFLASASHQSISVTAVLVIMILICVAEVISAIWVAILSGNIVCPCRGTDRGGEAKVYTNYRSQLSLIFGIIQIIIAVLTFPLGIAVIALASDKNNVFEPYSAIYIVAAIFYLPAGILGIVASFRKTLPLILSHMILCILATIHAGAHFLLALFHLLSLHMTSNNREALMACDSILTIIGLLEVCIAISASTFCCRVTCCGPSECPPRVYAAYKWTQGKIVGALQIVLGIMTFLLWIVALILPKGEALHNSFQNTIISLVLGYVTPCILVSIITGSFGVNAALHRTQPKVITHWILSLLTVFGALTQLAFSIFMLKIHHVLYWYFVAINALFLLIALALIGLSMWAAAISYLASVANAYSRHAEKSGKSGVPLSQVNNA